MATTQFRQVLTTEHVWDTVVLLSLLEDSDRRNVPLGLPHNGEQKDRFTDSMAARNERMVLEGQPELAHYCDDCMRVYDNPDGTQNKTQAVVSDGIAMGRPCCGDFRCQIPLANNRHRFCPEHSHLNYECAIVGCSSKVVEGSKSCADPVHQETERQLNIPGRSKAALNKRLKHVLTARTANSTTVEDAPDEDDDEVVFEEYAGFVHVRPSERPGSIGTLDAGDQAGDPSPCPATKSAQGNRVLKGLWHRRRTHNEQILVRPCGMMCGRVTMYGAEAVSNVLVRSFLFNLHCTSILTMAP